MSIKRKRSIQHDAPNKWRGWDWILQMHNRALTLDEDLKRGGRFPVYSLYFSTFFETGGRKEEVLLLQPQQIFWNSKIIKIERMEVLKRRVRFTRNVIIKIEGNPLAYPFIEHIENCDTKYLLPGYTGRFSTEIDPQVHVSSAHLYNKIAEIHPELWPHVLRDQRSWHLAAELEQGGRDMDIYLLKKWFEWASIEMPAFYAGRREEQDILDHLGVEDIKMGDVE